MDSVNYKNKKVGEREWQYNWQHVVFMTNKRRRNFKKEYNRAVARSAIEEAAHAYGIVIKEFSFGDDYAHIHMEVSVPNTLSISQVIQILKSHSASVIFQKIPNFMKLYPRGSFWGGQYSNHSVGPTDESTIKNYIGRRAVPNLDNQHRSFN